MDVVRHNITDRDVELAYIQGLGGRHRAEHFHKHVFQKPNICSDSVVYDGAALNLNFSDCMMQRDGDTVTAATVWGIQLEEDNGIDIRLAVINFASNVVAVNTDI